MAFYDKFVTGFFNRLAQAVKSSDLGAGGGMVMYADDPAGVVNFGWEAEDVEKLAFTDPWTFANLTFLMDEAGQATLEIFSRTGEKDKPVYNHDFEQLWVNGGNVPFMDDYLMMGFMAGWWLIKGEAYALLDKDKAGDLTRIIPIPSTHIRPIPDKTDVITGFAYFPELGKKGIRLPVDRVWYWRRMNPFSMANGLSIKGALKNPLFSSLAASEWNLDTFKKGLSVQTLISFDERLSAPLFKQAQADLEQAVYDDGKRFLSMRGGKMSAQAVGMSHRDAEYISGQELDRTKLDRILKFPSGFWDKESSYASAEVARLLVYRSAVWPMLVSAHKSLTKQVIKPLYGPELVARFKDERPDDKGQVMAEREHKAKSRTLNEVRAEQGDAPITGDQKKYGDTLFVLATNPQYVMGQDKPENPPSEAPVSPGETNKLPVGAEGAGGSADPAEAELATPTSPKAASGKSPVGQPKEDKPKDQPVQDETKMAVAAIPVIRAELKTWRRLARKEVDAGRRPADYKFATDIIPMWMYEEISTGLNAGIAVDSVFAPHLKAVTPVVLTPAGNAAGLLPVEDEIELTEADMDSAVKAWDTADFNIGKPNFVGMIGSVVTVGTLGGLSLLTIGDDDAA